MKQKLKHNGQSTTSKVNGSVWPHRLAVLTAGTTLFLIFVGALVTSKGAGLAVPDWPTTFGYNMFLYPWSQMVGGILYEHSHRLIGSAVGMLTICLVILLWIKESRKWLRWLGVLALILVIVQGVLGGLRVVLLENTLAIIHGAFAQALFALMVCLTLFTSNEWKKEPQKISFDDAGRLQRLCTLTASFIYIQLMIGAVLRHTGNWLGVHLLFAVIVGIHVFMIAEQILINFSDRSEMARPANGLRALLILQLMLGLSAYIGRLVAPEPSSAPLTVVLLTSGHVIIGSLMLATSLALTLRSYRLLIPESKPGQEFAPVRQVGGSEEVIA